MQPARWAVQKEMVYYGLRQRGFDPRVDGPRDGYSDARRIQEREVNTFSWETMTQMSCEQRNTRLKNAQSKK